MIFYFIRGTAKTYSALDFRSYNGLHSYKIKFTDYTFMIHTGQVKDFIQLFSVVTAL